MDRGFTINGQVSLNSSGAKLGDAFILPINPRQATSLDWMRLIRRILPRFYKHL